MKSLIFLAIGAIFLMGCCGSMSPSSSSSFCPYGTYGSACTNTCEKIRGTQFDEGPNCFSSCTSLVRSQGLGDATTCCTESIRNMCTRTCTAQADDLERRYGADAAAEREQYIQECFGECTGAYIQTGIPLESCAVVDVSKIIG